MEPDVLNIWQRTLSLPSDFDWNPVLVFKFCEIKDNKIKQFNFKFLHKLLPSRMILYVNGKLQMIITVKFVICQKLHSI